MLLCVFVNGITVQAETKECQKAKLAYQRHLKKVDGSKVNSFAIVDINQDGIPELLEGYNYGKYEGDASDGEQWVSAIYIYKKNKVKKITSKSFSAERAFYYHPKRKALVLYAGGTTNVYSILSLEKGKLTSGSSIGHPWYDEACTVRRAQLDGKWVSEKKYKAFFAKVKPVCFVENSAQNRKLFLINERSISGSLGNTFSVNLKKMAQKSIKYQSNKKSVVSVTKTGKIKLKRKGTAIITIVVNYYGRKEKYRVRVKSNKAIFNKKNNIPLVEMKVQSVQQIGNEVILSGKGRVPVDPQKTEKQRNDIENGKLTVLGKTWVVRSKYDEGLDVTFYYLFENVESEEYNYRIYGMPFLMNYPSMALYDRNDNMVYEDVGKIRVVLSANNCEFVQGNISYFTTGIEWKNQWIPMELNKNVVTKIEV